METCLFEEQELWPRQEADVPSNSLPDTFLAWNDALASRLFRPEKAGKATFLYVDERLIESIGGPSSLTKFVAAVIDGPPWVQPKAGLCQKALQALTAWRLRGLPYPPYIAYLSLFVLAVGVSGDFPAHAYYPRLWKLLGSPVTGAGMPPSFDRMSELWDDLEIWSNRDRSGELGIFSIRFAGSWINVGLPKAQAVLTEQERSELGGIFAAAALDPTEPPNDLELAEALRAHAGRVLRPVTLELLRAPGAEPELFSALLDAVRTELEDWNSAAADTAGNDLHTAVARVCLRLDDVAQTVVASLRISTAADFPEDGLQLADERANSFTCTEYVPGWSTPLRIAGESVEFNAAAVDWRQQHDFIDAERHWRVRMPGRRLRLFTLGRPFQLPGLVEIRQLARGRPFSVAVHSDLVPAITAWADSGEVRLRELARVQGLPAGWRMFLSDGASSDVSIRNQIRELAFPSTVGLRFEGGIRSSEGNSFFDFARPLLNMTGGSAEDSVWIGETQLEASSESADLYALPTRLRVGEPITAEVRRDKQVQRRLTFFLESGSQSLRPQPASFVDPFGICVVDNADALMGNGWISGARSSFEACDTAYTATPDFPAHHQFHVLGRRIAEIASAPALPWRHPWAPVWILDSRANSIEFCGSRIEECEPSKEIVGDRLQVRLWKEVVWIRRKRFRLPRYKQLASLWRRYLLVASHVNG